MAFFRNFESGMDSDNDLNEKEQEHTVAVSEEDSDGQRGPVDVPADEMLSDDYYEQDGEEQSDSLHGRGPSHHRISGTRLPPRPEPTRKSASKSSKATKYDEYDEDEDYDEEEEEDDDDPDDVDFEPDFGETSKSTKNKAKMSESDDFDEDDDEVDDLDLSDEEDISFNDSRHRTIRCKGGGSTKSTRENKSSIQSRRRRGRTFSDEEESSDNESEQDSDAELKTKTRKSLQFQKKNDVCLSGVNIDSHSNELRTSGRSVRKVVSYAESEESDEDEKSNKSQKVPQDDAEEDDGDSIERVLWHQPKGMAEDAIRNNRSADPVVLSTMSDSETEWDDVEFYIKWKGQSYLHCQWKSYSDLQNLTGFKKVLNYIKRVNEEMKFKRRLSREEAEVHNVGKEMELDLLKQYSQVERIFADRINKTSSDDVVPEYLVKWHGLSYAEATWEKDTDIAFAQDAIDEYKEGEYVFTLASQGGTESV